MLGFATEQTSNVSTVIFVDDFSGTGDTLTAWWDNVEPLIRPKGVEVVVGLLVMCSKARLKIERFAQLALCVDEVGDDADVLSDQNDEFSPAQKGALVRWCARTRCEARFRRGYGDMGLLLAFKHGCPNNSLPILWHDSRGWYPLFKRRAI
jgi:hypothetical protein